MTMTLDPDLLAAHAEAAHAAAVAHRDAQASKPDPRVRIREDGSQLTVCPGGVLVASRGPDDPETGDALDAVLGKACSATTKAGTPCAGRAGDDGLCAAHKDSGDS